MAPHPPHRSSVALAMYDRYDMLHSLVDVRYLNPDYASDARHDKPGFVKVLSPVDRWKPGGEAFLESLFRMPRLQPMTTRRAAWSRFHLPDGSSPAALGSAALASAALGSAEERDNEPAGEESGEA